MPRNTRAAARAEEAAADFNIAADETATDSPEVALSDADVTLQERPALIELTSNAVHEVEIAIEATDEKSDGKHGKETKRKGKEPKNATAKGTKKAVTGVKKQSDTSQNGRKVESDALMEQANAIDGSSSTCGSPAASDTVVEDGEDDQRQAQDTVLEKDCINTESEARHAAFGITAETPVEQDQRDGTARGATWHGTRVSLENETAPVTAPIETPAAQQLQSLFARPEEQAPEPLTALVEAANQPLPPSPAKKGTASDRKSDHSTGSLAPKPGTGGANTRTTGTALKKATAAKPHVRASLITNRTSMLDRRGSKAPVSTLKDIDNNRDAVKQPKPRSSIAALHSPPRAAKSSKPPTKPNFALPSDALREKLKMQKEERQKRQAENATQMAEKKRAVGPTIKPVRKSTNVSTTEVGAKAAGMQPSSVSKTMRPVDKPRPAASHAQKRAETLVQRARPSLLQSEKGEVSKTNPRKSSGPVVRENKAATLRRTGSVSKPAKSVSRTINKKPEPSVEPRIEAKKEEKPFDKAAAAKKARADAAERGRAASREWAEKQRKQLEEKKAAKQRKEEVREAEDQENIPPEPSMAAPLVA